MKPIRFYRIRRKKLSMINLEQLILVVLVEHRELVSEDLIFQILVVLEIYLIHSLEVDFLKVEAIEGEMLLRRVGILNIL